MGLREVVANETMNQLSRNLLMKKLVGTIRKIDFETKAFIRCGFCMMRNLNCLRIIQNKLHMVDTLNIFLFKHL